MTALRQIGFCFAILALALVGTAAAKNGGRLVHHAQHHPPAAAPDPQLIDLAGYKQAISKFHGKPLLVSFWATWCEPCQDEFPVIVQLAKEYEPQGLSVIGVSLDNDADMHLVRRFLARMKPAFRNYRQKPGIDVDAFYAGVNPNWTGTMPQTIFYTRDGHIAGALAGAQSRDTLERAIRFILGGPTPRPNGQ